MLVIIKSAPGTQDARRAVKLARDTAADIALLQNAVYLAQPERLEGFCGTAYAMGEDLKLRGIRDLEPGVKEIGYGELVDLMAEEDKVVGLF
ncbi:MAG: DsrH/TusB family sulfur metabolism protein [Nitrospirota bacterium]|jgi:sulfur relay protein TusB/DsrH